MRRWAAARLRAAAVGMRLRVGAGVGGAMLETGPRVAARVETAERVAVAGAVVSGVAEARVRACSVEIGPKAAGRACQAYHLPRAILVSRRGWRRRRRRVLGSLVGIGLIERPG